MPQDHVIFSCNIIPSPLNIANRQVLEKKLLNSNVRIFRDVHQSGHAAREDHRDMIKMLRPRHIIPSHVGQDKAMAMVSLAEELGYKSGKDVHVMNDGKKLEIR
jgi:ribonuclease J